MLRAVLPFTAREFARAVVMPNLSPPVTTRELVRSYRAEIVRALPEGARFTPLMTLYLTDTTSPREVVEAYKANEIVAVKLYPAHATTGSAAGVTRLSNVRPVLDEMAAHGVPLLVHGEVTDHDVDVFDRERVFLERELAPLVDAIPSLKVVLEHVTTREGVEFVKNAHAGIAATVTAHHLVTNRTDLFRGGVRPHLYCLPVPKREEHRRALVDVVTSGHARFFFGSDTAPHAREAKEAACGCAGVFSAPTALSVIAGVFEDAGALDKLEGFLSLHGPAFYGLAPNEERVELVRSSGDMPARTVVVGDTEVVVFQGETALRFMARPVVRA
jgi:dihydroorotase